ncbi:hypothetical protein DDB_G0287835 [Dictyostelium discoideum AX4]|uniref:Uncharacterized protein n=1 Tax=Dictyostelium discoideum TaxID=44689 RepID=Q54JR6_DICDI|nr:hypothetical protein DDB_G0287835 [Dictyostelium discoideum AX4]EAL63564.1 hypothetical protein DDB_G0287835 [Dictyostelium discoideum AX4]|eukprot:XP_637086.1 hypothetical protein DDB_G0287835 [Dictyostelium discoideum AX4]
MDKENNLYIKENLNKQINFYTKENLNNKLYKEVAKIARELGIKNVKGKKSEIIERIINFYHQSDCYGNNNNNNNNNSKNKNNNLINNNSNDTQDIINVEKLIKIDEEIKLLEKEIKELEISQLNRNKNDQNNL